jgi:hypothetical protein
MPARRRRRPGSDRLYVTSADGLPLGHLDLFTREAHDVPAGYRERFVQEANAWLWQNSMPPMGSPAEVAEPAAISAGVEPPVGGWDPGFDDLALHLPGHGLLEEAANARARGKLTRTPALRRGRGARWRILHTVPMAFAEGDVVLDHVLIGPPGVFLIEVANVPGGRAVLDHRSVDLGGGTVLELDRNRRIGIEAGERVSIALARAAGATETLDPPAVHPVIAIVGAIMSGTGRPRGVTVTRVGQLPRLLSAFGAPLSDLAVAQIHEVARRSTTWSP